MIRMTGIDFALSQVSDISIWTWFRQWCDLWRDRRRHGGRDSSPGPGSQQGNDREIAECGVRMKGFIENSRFRMRTGSKDLRGQRLANARKVMEQITKRKIPFDRNHGLSQRLYHGAAVSRDWQETAQRQRVPQVFITPDKVSVIKKSDENPMVAALYEGLLKAKRSMSFCIMNFLPDIDSGKQ